MDKNPALTLFSKANELKASDVHIVVGSPILFRIDGILTPQTKGEVTAAQAEEFVKAVLDDASWKRLVTDREIDVGFGLKDGIRMRVNCHFERGNVSLAARIIPSVIPSLEELGLTGSIQPLFELKQGLILFTGPTGAGKSTSLASIVHSINQARPLNIVTLEDPVEFTFPAGKGVIRQRQYGQDFLSFAEALKRVLRQDPDIVMVGEMRDPETIAAALTLAETGHLILATLHTPNAIQSVDRIIDVFEPHQQGQVRSQLSMSLKAIIAQRLVPREGGGRTALREILINTPAVGNVIREGRTQELKTVLQTNEGIGMITFEKAAKALAKAGTISKETYDMIIATI
jgi:twitching motility protein PilT